MAPNDDSSPPASMTAGAVTIVLTLLGWTCVPIFLRYFADHIDTWTSNGWRYATAALLWAPVVIMARLRGRTPPGLWRKAVWPAVFNICGQVCFTWAHYKIDPGLLMFGLRLQIVFVAVAAYMLFPAERRVVRSWRYLLGFALVLGGTLGTAALGREPLTGSTLFGIVLAVLSGAFFAAYSVAVRRCMHGVHPVTAFAAISQYTAGAMVLLMLALGARAGAEALELTGGQFALLLLSAVIGIALGHVFFYIAIARLGVAVSSGVIQLQPFTVGAVSYFVFGERLTPAQWVTGTGAVAGALLMLEAQRRVLRRRAPTTVATGSIAACGAATGKPLP